MKSLLNFLSYDDFDFFKNFNLNHFIYSSIKNFFYNLNYKNKNINNIKNGILDIFEKIFPIFIFDYCAFLNFLNLKIIPSYKNFYSCIKDGSTYFLSLKAKFNIIFYENILNLNSVKFIKEEEIFICDIPFINKKGTFVINGIEKSVISKFVISPGIYLDDKKNILNVKILPYKGYDLNFILKKKNIYLNVKKYNLPLFDLIKSLGLNIFEIINNVFNYDYIYIKNKKFKIKIFLKNFLNFSFKFDILDDLGKILIKKNHIIDYNDILNFKNLNINYLNINNEYLKNKRLACDLYDNFNFKFANFNSIIDFKIINKIKKNNISNFKIINNFFEDFEYILDTINIKNLNSFDSIIIVNKFFQNLKYSIFEKEFLNFEKIYIKNYIDISKHCRDKINKIFKKNFLEEKNILINDILNIFKLIISFKNNILKKTDLQNINNLILKTPGNIIYDIIYDNFYYLKTLVNSKFFYKKNMYNIFPSDYLNFSFIKNDINSFFCFSEFSQFLDQTNVLSELSHKRRVNFTGIRGISKDYSGFDVRDLNSSHYSRLCPVETPEGINIGLVSSLSLFSITDKNGFLISPFYKIKNKKIDKIVYLNSDDEVNYFISDYNSFFSNSEFLLSRYNNQLINLKKDFVNFIDLKSYQMFSVNSVLVPFLEYNDSNRVLMASNMFKQVLPVLFPEKPFVATGLEDFVGINTSEITFSNSKGFIIYLDSNLIIIKKFINFRNYYYYNYDFYFLKRYRISNQNTIIDNKTFLNLNDKINIGTILIDNANTINGTLCLGHNILTGFMSWEGYNFEDSIIISDKLIIDEKYTSLEILNLDIPVFNTKNGFEIITKNFSFIDELYENLDEFGLIKIGSYIKGGDIILSKVTPILNYDNNISPEKNLLNTIFNKKIKNTIDSSFYLPNNFNYCTIKNVEIYFSKNLKLNNYDKIIYNNQVKKNFLKRKIIYDFFKKKILKKIKNFLLNKKIFLYKFDIDSKLFINKFSIFNINFNNVLKINLENNYLNKLFLNFKKKIIKLENNYNFIKFNIKNNKFFKDLPLNICKLIKICIIIKKKLQIGDKMCGRHGNKGVISKILPSNQMPYLLNGRALDMILNPLGVPSRMNIGQLLEIHLGLTSLLISWKFFDMLYKNVKIDILRNFIYKIYSNSFKENQIKFYNNKMIKELSLYFINGVYFKIPPFNSFNINNINYLLNLIIKDCNLNFNKNNKQFYLYDGRDGRKFDNPITIGYMYFLKLNHLSSNKLHSRSTGPYSLVTQQPLRGKSNFGGQRLGEMEVWALEAYGASYTLNEMLTVKSDDISGRFEIYKNIINGYLKFVGNKPEIFDVMIKNINSLSIFVRLTD